MRITKIYDSTIFTWWLNDVPEGSIYVSMAEQARLLGCPNVTPALMRRDLKRRLRNKGFLPLDRKLTSADYDAARTRCQKLMEETEHTIV